MDSNQSWDREGNGYDQGREWLARHSLNTDRDLSKDEVMSNAPKGAMKLYNAIKSMTLDHVTNMDFFR